MRAFVLGRPLARGLHPLAPRVDVRPLLEPHPLRRHGAAPDVAAREAVGAACGANALRVVHHDAVGEMAVAHLALDSDVPCEAALRAFAVHVVGDELVEMPARLARDAQSGDEAVVQRDVGEREVVRVCDGEAAREAVAVDVAALDEDVQVVVDGAVWIVHGERVVIRGTVPEHDILHLRPRHQVRCGMHRERATVGDQEHGGDVILPLGDVQHAVRRDGDRAHEARRIVCLAGKAREVRETYVPFFRSAERAPGGHHADHQHFPHHHLTLHLSPFTFHFLAAAITSAIFTGAPPFCFDCVAASRNA